MVKVMAFSASIEKNKRLISLAYLGFVLVVFAALAGCERSGPPASQALSQQKSEEIKPKTDAAVEVKEAVGSLESEKKEISCSYDAECSGYFRCIGEVCAVPPA